MARMTRVVSNRPFTLRSTKGFTVRFSKAGEKKDIPNAILNEAMQAGILPVEDNAEVTPEDQGSKTDPKTPELSEGPKSATEREEKVREAVLTLVERNDSDDFTGTGMPQVGALSREAEFKVDSSERDAVWEVVARELQELADAEPQEGSAE